MVQFESEKISPAITRIKDGSDVCEYLIEGSERAALIDTGYGIGDLKGFVETLTEKPYDVFITHGHVDHAAGASQFPEVRMNLADMDVEKEHCTVEFRKEMVKSHTKLNVEDADFVPQRTESFTDLQDGEVFDLGGLTLRWIHGSVLDRGAGKGKCKSNRGEAGGKGNGGTGDRSGNGRQRLGGGAL